MSLLTYPVRKLIFKGCDGDRTDLKPLEECFKSCMDLNELSLIQCKEFGAGLLALGLKQCTRLERLILCSSKFKENAKVFDSTRNCLNLKMLDISTNSLRDANSAGWVSGFLKYCPKLEDLFIPFTFGNIPTTFIQNLKCCPNLRTLSLSGVDKTLLVDILTQFPKLEALRLYNSNIGSDGAKLFQTHPNPKPNLKSLDLENCIGLGNIGMKHLQSALAHYPNLQRLSLSQNNIDCDGAKAIAEGLLCCPNLEVLNLGWNKIGSDGAKAIAKGLLSCLKLQELYLDENLIGDDGAKALAKDQIHCPNLRTLDLKSNPISTDCVKALSDTSQPIALVF